MTGGKTGLRSVAATVKINAAQLESAQGIRIGIAPSSKRHSDLVRVERGLVVCPLPHDGAFMQTFYEAWRIVRAVLDEDCPCAQSSGLPRPPEREVARVLAERRSFPVREIVEVLGRFGQPGLVVAEDASVGAVSVPSRTFWTKLFSRLTASETPAMPHMPVSISQTVLAPMPLAIS